MRRTLRSDERRVLSLYRFLAKCEISVRFGARKIQMFVIRKICAEKTCPTPRLPLLLETESDMNRALLHYFSFAFTYRSIANYCGGSGSAELVRGEVSK
jgi:hypothetical protein